jgi:hypothetical protein
MAKNLTDQQRLFLEVLFEQANGDVLAAKRMAGYSDTTSTSYIVNALKDEIAEATRAYLARIAPKAAVSMSSAMDDPTQLGLKEKMIAARDVLDRTGYAKSEKVEIGGSAIFILPPKNADEDDE